MLQMYSETIFTKCRYGFQYTLNINNTLFLSQNTGREKTQYREQRLNQQTDAKEEKTKGEITLHALETTRHSL